MFEKTLGIDIRKQARSTRILNHKVQYYVL